MQLFNINTVYGLVETLYGITPNESNFEDIVMNGWSYINNKHTRLYRYVADADENGVLDLPCNVDVIESVHIPMPDAKMTSNKTVFNEINTLFTEGYIDAWKRLEDPYWTMGKLVKYDEGNNQLFFARPYKNIMVVYHGIIADEETGLPLVTDKEIKALAAYVAYASLYREGIQKRNPDIIQFAQTIYADWLKLCNAARIPEHLSQNEMDSILDVKTRWDRKQYGRSYKPTL